MKVVRNKATGRLVYREDPESDKVGVLLAHAIMEGLGDYMNLEEYEATQEEWDKEVAQYMAEKPPTEMDLLKQEIEKLKDRVKALESKPRR